MPEDTLNENEPGTAAQTVAAIAAAINDEGGRPGSSIHSWRCEYPDTYGECDCALAAKVARVEAEMRALRDAWSKPDHFTEGLMPVNALSALINRAALAGPEDTARDTQRESEGSGQ